MLHLATFQWFPRTIYCDFGASTCCCVPSLCVSLPCFHPLQHLQISSTFQVIPLSLSACKGTGPQAPHGVRSPSEPKMAAVSDSRWTVEIKSGCCQVEKMGSKGEMLNIYIYTYVHQRSSKYISCDHWL